MNNETNGNDKIEIICIVKNSETLEDLLVYRNVEDSFIWAKPLRVIEEEKEEYLLDIFNLINEEFVYKIALPVDDDEINYSFESSQVFKILEITNVKNITNEYLISIEDGDAKDKIDILSINNVKVLITNLINDNSYKYARKSGLGVIAGINGKCENIIQDYLDGKLFCNKTKIIKTLGDEH